MKTRIYRDRTILVTATIMALVCGCAQAAELPLCRTPDEVLSGTRLTVGTMDGYFDWQSEFRGFKTSPVFHLDFVTCIPDILRHIVGMFQTRDAQLFELQPRGLIRGGTARSVDPSFYDHGERRRCSHLSTTADICIERAPDRSVIFVEKNTPPVRRIPLIVSRTRPIKGFAFFGSPDSPAGLVSLWVDRRTGYDFIIFDIYQAPSLKGFGSIYIR